ncbi:MAG: sugar ABC transporter ATP-binding protein [Verrucomicrobiae bacterium]|nr:sugar ABC transporter ATP-binding protein [Verrucomicrobiae bacterium]
MATTHSPQGAAAGLLTFRGITKAFFGVRVLKSVSFSVPGARIVGLVGENGAGKSTLMNVLGGNLAADEGSMRFAGKPYSPRVPRDARDAGIGFVHQELNLFPNLSIAENLFLTGFPTMGPFIRRAGMRDRTDVLLQRVGLRLSPDAPVETLSPGERQLVEIAHALSFDARLILLDEPTTSLSARECGRLFALMRQLRAEGRSIIFISHALGDVLRICDEVVVLRDGEVVGQGPATGFDQPRLVSLMVGRELKQLFPDRRRNGPPEGSEALLEVRSLTQPGVIRDISFTLHQGEVLGLSGLMGAGRTELARILFGLDPFERGSLRIAGQPLHGSPRRRIRRGLAMLTENRRDDGLCLEASVADNLALVTLPQYIRPPLGMLDPRRLGGALARIREAVRLQPSVRLEQTAGTLSGGNQQKVVLAKWLLAEPRVLILDEPTRGIDVGAKFEIYQLILELADRGAGVIVISSEIEELIGLCDRILVLSRGALSGEFSRDAFDREKILHTALAGHDRGEGKP